MSEPNGNGGRFSLADLAAASQPSEIRRNTRAGGDNPFLDKVRESHDLDKQRKDSGWREVKVPSTMLDDLITSMRALSAWFGENREPIGVHLKVEYQPDGADEMIEVGPGRFDEIPRDGRDVYFKYTGRDRMKRGRRRQAAPQQPAAGLAADVADEVEDDDSELQPA